MYCQRKVQFMQDTMPKEVKYFKEDVVSEILEIPIQKPDMQKILKTFASIEVEDMNLIPTEIGLSNEGQNLTGYKLVIELKINQKVIYAAADACNSVHSAHFELLKTVFVVLPKEIDGENICELVRAGRARVNPFVEASKAKQIDERTFNQCILLLVDVKVC